MPVVTLGNHFKSFIGPSVQPAIDWSGDNIVAELEIGQNVVLGLFYVLQVIIIHNSDPDIWGEPPCDELMFTIQAYRVKDEDDEDPVAVFYSGSETKAHFTDLEFRSQVLRCLLQMVEIIVKDKGSERITFVAKCSALPPRALPKYDMIAQKLIELGYKSDQDSRPKAILENKFSWYFTR